MREQYLRESVATGPHAVNRIDLTPKLGHIKTEVRMVLVG